jgi:hypothetical protein
MAFTLNGHVVDMGSILYAMVVTTIREVALFVEIKNITHEPNYRCTGCQAEVYISPTWIGFCFRPMKVMMICPACHKEKYPEPLHKLIGVHGITNTTPYGW